MPRNAEPNVPIRHHYVPRAYLAQFTRERTTERGHVWVYERDAAHVPSREPVVSVAYEPHLYTVPDADGNSSSDLERRLARSIERPFLAWHRRVVCAPRGQAAQVLSEMTKQQATAVARYIAYQCLRTPAQRLLDARLSELSHAELFSLRKTQANLEAAWRRWGRNAGLPLTGPERRVEIERWMTAMEALARQMRSERPHTWLRPLDRFAEMLLPFLLDGKAWRLVELSVDVAHELPLLTCDNPVVLARSRADADPGLEPGWDVGIGGGWDEPGLEVTLTLSPRHALMLAQNPEALTLADDPVRFAESVRVRTVRHALHQVYSRDEDDQVATLVRSTRTPDVYFELGGELLPSTINARELMRRMARMGSKQIGVRYTAPPAQFDGAR